MYLQMLMPQSIVKTNTSFLCWNDLHPLLRGIFGLLELQNTTCAGLVRFKAVILSLAYFKNWLKEKTTKNSLIKGRLCEILMVAFAVLLGKKGNYRTIL
ncbi:hypothetical protein HS088_TW09G01378 [Tripterygium wilfordii]|uniref:Uncharacterized protein n=1 Tax=Tripterygium wilfordii TaxID=458696 RepID=A0A7J7DAD4_TRIWF|nr:hypothetical protein HS088_TW09G01378 [Tripterygium wilfordii]